MQTNIHPQLTNKPYASEANRILRSCVHCGFCNAICPTYQLLGDELDGPRGRIYLIKQMLEDNRVSKESVTHIDRCLTCGACETVCPSGVDYVKLVDIGRDFISNAISATTRTGRVVNQTLREKGSAGNRKDVTEGVVRPGLYQTCLKYGLRLVVPFPNRLGLLVALGRLVKPLLSADIRRLLGTRKSVIGEFTVAVTPVETVSAVIVEEETGKDAVKSAEKSGEKGVEKVIRYGTTNVILLGGCAQKVATPGVNQALKRLLLIKHINVIDAAGDGCCGALDYHLSATEAGLNHMRRLIDSLWPYVAVAEKNQVAEKNEKRISAIISSASGCGVTLKEYGHYLKNDPNYAEKAREISALVKDASEVLDTDNMRCKPVRVALQAPCSLQHGLKLAPLLESLLQRLGFELVEVPESHMCCGSAGSYSLTQPKIASELRQRKLKALVSGNPQVIVTANVGCQLHLGGARAQDGKSIPVMHWVELVEQTLLTVETASNQIERQG